jgi:hypothetical protein
VKQITPGYLQEPEAETRWGFILRNQNISEGMENPASVSRLAGNWKYFAKDLDLCTLGLAGVEAVAKDFANYLDQKAKAGSATVSAEDIAIFVANKAWEAKLANAAIISPALLLQAQVWQVKRDCRGQLHEAIYKTCKFQANELKSLLELTGTEHAQAIDARFQELEERIKAFLDGLFTDRFLPPSEEA